MKRTVALSTRMRQLLANLHPPSPPTTQESRKLLGVLQSSFQQQLDASHPAPFQKASSAHERTGIFATRQSDSPNATTHYLGSVLAHPTLRQKQSLSPLATNAAHFDQLVAESRVTFPELLGLLTNHCKTLRSPRAAQDHERMSDRLDSWLHATDRSTREAFFLDGQMKRAISDLLFLEKNEAVAWKWLEMVYERKLVHAPLDSAQWLWVEDRLVSTLIRMAIQQRHYNEAAEQFVQACRYRVESGRTSGLHPCLMLWSSRRLVSAILFHGHDHGISSGTYTEMLQCLPSTATVGVHNTVPFAAVYHPQAPSAKKLVKFLKTPDEVVILLDQQAKVSSIARKAVMNTILNASRLALDQGYRADASFLLNFAIDNYPDFLPARETEEVEAQLETTFSNASHACFVPT